MSEPGRAVDGVEEHARVHAPRGAAGRHTAGVSGGLGEGASGRVGESGGKGQAAGGHASRPVDYSDANLTLDADEDRWEWRARLRRNKVSHLVWRVAVGVVGGAVTVAGLIMVPAPGPGWLVVFFGLVILASEFEFAQRLLDFAKQHVSRWNDWVMAQAMWVRGLVALGTVALVWLVLWAYLAWRGIPAFLPQWVEDLLSGVPGLG
jgi:uncharacterized protein (TIGR02611 family)